MLYRPIEPGRYRDRADNIWRVTHPVHRSYCGPSFAEAARQRWHGYCESHPDCRTTWDSQGYLVGYCIPQQGDLVKHLGPLTELEQADTIPGAVGVEPQGKAAQIENT